MTASIVSVSIGQPSRVRGSFGDTWSCGWTAGDELLTVADDTTAFGSSGWSASANLAVHRLTGSPPALEGTTVNLLPQYGSLAEVSVDDGASWKAMSLTAVGDSLYMTVSRHRYMARPLWLQETFDASIIRSDDGGVTWTAPPQLGQAMFPGRTFSTPFLIEHGRANSKAQDRFVYAVSSDGVWADGSGITLGRVPAEHLANLDPRDWEFFHGFGEFRQLSQADLEDSGELGEPLWSPRHDAGRYIFNRPGRTSMTGVHYMPGLRTYVMPQWYHPDLHEAGWPDRWRRTRLDFYQADAPWGPWEWISGIESSEGFYSPTLPGKLISATGTEAWLFLSRDFTTAGKRDDGDYALWVAPIQFGVKGL